jgi:hypothetical protein
MTQAPRGNKGNRQSRAFDKLLTQAADDIARLDTNLGRLEDHDINLTGLSLRPPSQTRDGDWLVVVRAQVGGEAVVAFHGAATLLEALPGTIRRILNHTIEWKVDEYAR